MQPVCDGKGLLFMAEIFPGEELRYNWYINYRQ